MAIIVIVAVITGAVLYSRNSASAAEDGTPTVQTAKVRKGDDRSSQLVALVWLTPAAQVDFAFRSAGVLYELNIQLGDQVASDEVLARLKRTFKLKQIFRRCSAKLGSQMQGLLLPMHRLNWIMRPTPMPMLSAMKPGTGNRSWKMPRRR